MLYAVLKGLSSPMALYAVLKGPLFHNGALPGFEKALFTAAVPTVLKESSLRQLRLRQFKHKAALRADSCFLDLALAAPLLAFGLGGVIQGIDQQAAEAVAAVQVCAHNLKSDFIRASAPQQDVGANL